MMEIKEKLGESIHKKMSSIEIKKYPIYYPFLFSITMIPFNQNLGRVKAQLKMQDNDR